MPLQPIRPAITRLAYGGVADRGTLLGCLLCSQGQPSRPWLGLRTCVTSLSVGARQNVAITPQKGGPSPRDGSAPHTKQDVRVE